MIFSKFILFFCFCLLLLDNSLGNDFLKKKKNRMLFDEALDFGKKIGGDLRILASQWKQYVQEIALAQRKVGFHKDQLERLNDAAREVGHAEKDVDFYKKLYRKAPVPDFRKKLKAAKEIYAKKFAFMVGIRAQDISKDQKRISEMEAEKDAIAVKMINKMAEIKEDWSEKNLRKNIKEAKERGATEKDIKNALFAHFRESEGFGTRGGSPDALLESFGKGIQHIVDGTFIDEDGIIKYGNIIGGCLNGIGCGDDGGDSDAGENFLVPDGAGGDAGGGDPPGGDPSGGGAGGGDPPDGPPDDEKGDEDGPPDDEEGDEDGPPDDEEGDEEGDDEGNEGDDELEYAIGEVDIDIEDFREYDEGVVQAYESLLFSPSSDKVEEGHEGPRPAPKFSDIELDEAIILVNSELEARRNRLEYFGNELGILAEERADGYYGSRLLRYPTNRDLNRTERLNLYRDRARHVQTLLIDLTGVFRRYRDFRDLVLRDYDRARQHFFYYAQKIGGNMSDINPSFVPASTPPDLPEYAPYHDYRNRYLISRTHMSNLGYIARRITDLGDGLREEDTSLRVQLEAEESRIAYEQKRLGQE